MSVPEYTLSGQQVSLGCFQDGSWREATMRWLASVPTIRTGSLVLHGMKSMKKRMFGARPVVGGLSATSGECRP
jgi:hypothetical protein